MGGGRMGDKQAERAEQDHDADMEEMRDSEGETEEYAYDSGPAVEPNISHYPFKLKSAIIIVQFVAMRGIATIICDASVLAVPSSKFLDRDGRARAYHCP
jgi:hypothetical protein